MIMTRTPLLVFTDDHMPSRLELVEATEVPGGISDGLSGIGRVGPRSGSAGARPS